MNVLAIQETHVQSGEYHIPGAVAYDSVSHVRLVPRLFSFEISWERTWLTRVRSHLMLLNTAITVRYGSRDTTIV